MRTAGTRGQSYIGFTTHLNDPYRYHTHPKFLPYPTKHVNLRGIEEDKYVLIDITEFERGGLAKLIEEIEVSRALFEVYEGGVVRTARIRTRNKTHLFRQFIHQGLTFIVHSISHDSRVARLRRADVNWVTGARWCFSVLLRFSH